MHLDKSKYTAQYNLDVVCSILDFEFKANELDNKYVDLFLKVRFDIVYPNGRKVSIAISDKHYCVDDTHFSTTERRDAALAKCCNIAYLDILTDSGELLETEKGSEIWM